MTNSFVFWQIKTRQHALIVPPAKSTDDTTV